MTASILPFRPAEEQWPSAWAPLLSEAMDRADDTLAALHTLVASMPPRAKPSAMITAEFEIAAARALVARMRIDRDDGTMPELMVRLRHLKALLVYECEAADELLRLAREGA